MKKYLKLFFVIFLLSPLLFIKETAHAQAQNGTTLTATKTADGHFTRTFHWTIDKSVTPEIWNLFIGDSAESKYTVSVTKDNGTDSAFVDGQICVTNGGDVATENLAITDVIQTKSGGGQFQDYQSQSIDLSVKPVLNAGESFCYPYSIFFTPVPNAQYRNVAEITITNHSGSLGTPFGPNPKADFSMPSNPTLINDSINVDDTNGQTWLFNNSGSQQYLSTQFTCGDEIGTKNYDNTATIRQTGQSDSARVTVNCFDPTVAKTANTSFDRFYRWNIVKTGDQTNLTLAKGESFPVNYTVTPSVISTDGNWAVTGTIIVHNPAPIPATINSVKDFITGAIEVDPTCPATFPFILTPGADLVCTYSQSLPDATTRTNTATAKQQNYSYDFNATPTPSGTTDFSGSANVDFSRTTPTEHDKCISVTDDKAGISLGTRCAPDTTPFTYQLTIGPHDSCGTKTYTNTATFTTNDTGATGSSSWTVNTNVPCLLGCALTIGYWKNHSGSQSGPQSNMVQPLLAQCLGGLSSLSIGCLTFGPKSLPVFLSSTAYQILGMNYSGGTASNGITKLYAQLLGAKLNMQNGAGNTIPLTVAGADTFLMTHNQSSWSSLSKSDKNNVLSWMTALDNYNNGLSGVPHCSQ